MPTEQAVLKGRTVALGVGVWARKHGERIHIHITGSKHFHTTVTNEEGSERYHRTLFRSLRRLLLDNGAWPYGREGAETARKAKAKSAKR